jgi:hypothetical protein
MKVPYMKFHGNSYIGSLTNICRQTERKAGMTKLVGTSATVRMRLTLAIFSSDTLPATLTACSPVRKFNISMGLRIRSPASLDEILAILGFLCNVDLWLITDV